MISVAQDITGAGHKLQMKPKLAPTASPVSLSFSILFNCCGFLM